MDRIVSQGLAKFDGIPTTSSGGTGGSEGVFVISATKRQDPFNPVALLTSRQFDRLVHPWHV